MPTRSLHTRSSIVSPLSANQIIGRYSAEVILRHRLMISSVVKQAVLLGRSLRTNTELKKMKVLHIRCFSSYKRHAGKKAEMRVLVDDRKNRT